MQKWFQKELGLPLTVVIREKVVVKE